MTMPIVPIYLVAPQSNPQRQYEAVMPSQDGTFTFPAAWIRSSVDGSDYAPLGRFALNPHAPESLIVQISELDRRTDRSEDPADPPKCRIQAKHVFHALREAALPLVQTSWMSGTTALEKVIIRLDPNGGPFDYTIEPHIRVLPLSEIACSILSGRDPRPAQGRVLAQLLEQHRQNEVNRKID